MEKKIKLKNSNLEKLGCNRKYRLALRVEENKRWNFACIRFKMEMISMKLKWVDFALEGRRDAESSERPVSYWKLDLLLQCWFWTSNVHLQRNANRSQFMLFWDKRELCQWDEVGSQQKNQIFTEKGLNCSARASFSRSNLIDVNSALADNSANSDIKLYHLCVHEDFNIFIPSHSAAHISALNITLLISLNLWLLFCIIN